MANAIVCKCCQQAVDIVNFTDYELTRSFPRCRSCRSDKYKQKCQNDPLYLEKARQRGLIWRLKNKKKRSDKFKKFYYFQDGKRILANKRLLKKYGITLDQYNTMLEQQNYCCAICKTEPTNIALAVDHCHTSGKIRKLLCSSCNRCLGVYEKYKDKFEEYLGEIV